MCCSAASRTGRAFSGTSQSDYSQHYLHCYQRMRPFHSLQLQRHREFRPYRPALVAAPQASSQCNTKPRTKESMPQALLHTAYISPIYCIQTTLRGSLNASWYSAFHRSAEDGRTGTQLPSKLRSQRRPTSDLQKHPSVNTLLLDLRCPTSCMASVTVIIVTLRGARGAEHGWMPD
jgi:hypothetical protein